MWWTVWNLMDLFLQERFQAAALISVNRANWLTRLGTNTLVYTANMFTGSPAAKKNIYRGSPRVRPPILHH
jgi:hypothetical protein